ncbi:MAG: hypothetical protein ACUVTW_00375 [Thermogutta sp.]
MAPDDEASEIRPEGEVGDPPGETPEVEILSADQRLTPQEEAELSAAERHAGRLGFPFVDLRGRRVRRDILHLVPDALARDYLLVPLGFSEERLVLAMANPPSPDLSDRLRFALDHTIRVVLAAEWQLRAAVRSIYRRGEVGEKEDTARDRSGRAAIDEAGIDFVQVPEAAESVTAAALAVDPDSPDVTRTIQSLLGEAIRIGAQRVVLAQFKDRVKVAFRVDDGIVTRSDLPPDLLLPVAVRLIAMINFFGWIKVVVKGQERRLRLHFRNTPYGLSVLLECSGDAAAVTEAARERAVRLSLPFHDLQDVHIPADVLSTVPADVARDYMVLPLSVRQEMVTVAVAEPRSPQALDDLRFRLNRPLEPVMAPEGRLRMLIERLYGPTDPESLTLILAELSQNIPPGEWSGKQARFDRPAPPEGHPAEAILTYLRQCAGDKLLDLFEDIRRRPKLCTRSADKWALDVVIPRSEMLAVLPSPARSYLESRLWVLREAIISHFLRMLGRHPELGPIVLSYSLYVAACRLAESDRGIPFDPVLLFDEWFNFLFCYTVKQNPGIDTHAAILNYLAGHADELVRRVAAVAEDPAMMPDPAAARAWLTRLRRHTPMDDVFDEKSPVVEHLLALHSAKAKHYRASHMVIAPRDDRLEFVYRIRNTVLADHDWPVYWLLPVLSRLIAGSTDGVWQCQAAGRTAAAEVRLHATPAGLAAMIAFREEPRAVEAAQALAVSHNLRFVKLGGIEPRAELLQRLDGGIARHLGVLPIEEEGDAVVVAAAQPPTARRLQQLQLLFDRPAVVAIAAEDDLRAAIYSCYPPPGHVQPSGTAIYLLKRYAGLVDAGL